jgi:hypothetical protein
MKRAPLLLALTAGFSQARAEPQSAANVCAQAANKVIGDANFVLEKARQPCIIVERYRIKLQSENAHNVECVVSYNRLWNLIVDG